jgi:HlyD family secretion protein
MNYETSITSPAGQKTVDALDPDGEQSGRRRIIIIAIIAAVLIAAATAFYFAKRENSAATATGTAAGTGASGEKAGQAQNVTVVSPGSDTVVRLINATGTIAARNDTPVGVVGEGGQVARVFVDAGDWVKQGQTLISIERSVQVQQAAALQAQIGVARADMQLAENELNRALQLVDRGFISKADVDRKTATRNSARARVNVAQAQLNEAVARNARLDIRAPISGYVLERKVEPGQTVTGGSGTLFRIAQGGEMELQALLGEADLAGVSPGVLAVVTPVGDTRTFTGRIWQIAPTIDAQSRQGIARIALPFNIALRPGGFANAEIAAGATTAPMLPESAIQTDKDGNFVYIVDSASKAIKRRVVIGKVTATGIPVLSGLGGSERVVLRAGGFLSEGEVVKPVFEKKSIQ